MCEGAKLETVPCQIFTKLNKSEWQAVRAILQRASESQLSGVRTHNEKRLDELVTERPEEGAK